jgi:hypothetical protein
MLRRAPLTLVNAAPRDAGLVCGIDDRDGGMDDMNDFRFDPPLVVKNMPKPTRLASLADARAFVDAELRLGRPPPWREMYHRLTAARTEEEANEAIGALRELLELEDLLIPPNLPLTSQHHD